MTFSVVLEIHNIGIDRNVIMISDIITVYFLQGFLVEIKYSSVKHYRPGKEYFAISVRCTVSK